MGSLRQDIIRLLREREMTARELSQTLGIQERDVYDHMCHVKKTLKTSGENLSVIPPRCLKCGFEFRNRKRVTAPSRCPVCKGEYVSAPVFRISG